MGLTSALVDTRQDENNENLHQEVPTYCTLHIKYKV